MTTILGISAFYHDSAAALVRDGTIVAAAQEERFSRVKHDHRFPRQAARYCLSEAGIDASELDHVVFYDKPLLKLDRLIETYLAFAPAGYRSLARALPLWLRTKLQLPRQMDRGLDGGYRGRYIFTEHHESHAASAFYPSPFRESAILTLDGVGEWATSTLGVGRDNRIELLSELRFPHSIGLLYSAFTAYCGFRVNSGEYKLMGLAPYGEPRFADLIRDKLVQIYADGSIRLDMRYFNYCQGLTMTNERLHALLGAPPRQPEGPHQQHYMDVAASIQQVTEEIVLAMARHARAVTGQTNLCMAGGVALNCVATGRLIREAGFDGVWVQPAAGDAGGALGAALFVWHQLMDRPRTVGHPDGQQGSLLGPRFEQQEINHFLRQQGAVFRVIEQEEQLLDWVARAIADQKVVGFFQGRMEFGPRALGSRSILGDARSREMQSVMNLKIKFRESFRPFAPSVLAERAHDYFELAPAQESPYMLQVAPVVHQQRLPVHDEMAQRQGLDKLPVARSTVPAVTHVDFSARVQTVDAVRHCRYHRLIDRFQRLTGCPVIINTSFNVRGEPIVCTPQDAYGCFMATEMDVLVLENAVLEKDQQPEVSSDRAGYLARFALD